VRLNIGCTNSGGEKQGANLLLKHVGYPVLPSPSTNFVSLAGGTMGNSTLIKRGTEILVAGNTHYAGATANLMSSTLLCEYNNIKNMSSDRYQLSSNGISNLIKDEVYINSVTDADNVSDANENQSGLLTAESTASLTGEEEILTADAAAGGEEIITLQKSEPVTQETESV